MHLPYTYKKRFNEIMKSNMTGSNYPRARTSARQEVTIGNVLDYLDRVVAEKNQLKSELKEFKKDKRNNTADDQSAFTGRSKPRSLKNTAHLSEVADSDISASETCRKTFDYTSGKKSMVKKHTSLLLKGKSKSFPNLSYQVPMRSVVRK